MSEARARRRAGETAFVLASSAAAALLAAAFLWIVGCLVARGGRELSLGFLLEAPARAGLEGGIAPVLVSTAGVLVVALGVAVPLGLGTALWLAEFARAGGRRARVVRTALDLLAGVPSIVFGLFGNAVFCVAMGLGYSLLAGGLTLACMILPFLIRSIEVALRGVPWSLRAAGAALDLSHVTRIRHVLLPSAVPGLVAGLLLGIARASAETAALLFTSGATERMPEALTDSGRVLSIHVLELAMNVPGGETRAMAAALVLVVALLVIHSVARAIVERFVGADAGERR